MLQANCLYCVDFHKQLWGFELTCLSSCVCLSGVMSDRQFGTQFVCSVVASHVSHLPSTSLSFIWIAPPPGTGCVNFMWVTHPTHTAHANHTPLFQARRTTHRQSDIMRQVLHEWVNPEAHLRDRCVCIKHARSTSRHQTLPWRRFACSFRTTEGWAEKSISHLDECRIKNEVSKHDQVWIFMQPSHVIRTISFLDTNGLSSHV